MTADPTAEQVLALMSGLLRRTHLSEAANLGRIVAEQAATVGARDTEIHLIDYEQATLVAMHPRDGQRLSVAGTVAGRSFATTEILRTEAPEGGERVWLPLLDGTERIGVIGMRFDDALSEAFVVQLERFAHLVALVVVTKSAYSDVFEVARRRERMTVATELAWSLVPPLVFATDGLAVAGMLEPAYDNGGDTFDYAVNDRVLHVGLFDAMGHGLAAAGAAGLALAAYRHSRRGGDDLAGTHSRLHQAIGAQFGNERFVTALLARLDIDSGRLSWISAGHPRPLLIRRGRRATSLEGEAAVPLGVEMGALEPVVACESLEPGDFVLLYTDGLSEARAPDGGLFTEERLAEFIDQAAAAGQATPETLRRLRHAILERGATLRDDASAVLIQWAGDGERAMVPDQAV